MYHFPIDVHLTGELGAGKTTFLQGLAEGLGIATHATSPTFALEQRHASAKGTELIHIDLYRLNPTQARELIASTDDHTGIRCIEWADRLPAEDREGAIEVALKERDDGRACTVTFADIALPDTSLIDTWRDEFRLPPHIRAHCEGVARVADALADALLERGILVRKHTLHLSARLHDLLRFVDFKKPEFDAETERHWREIRNRYAGMRHEDACAAFLREQGFPALADIIAVHGLRLPAPDRTTIEQRLLFYADKRVAEDRTVTLRERFDDFNRRYGGGMKQHSAGWLEDAARVERDLFPDGPPV